MKRDEFQKRRLRWLRSALSYTGSLNLGQFMRIFGVGTSQASRDKANLLDEIGETFGKRPVLRQDGIADSIGFRYDASDLMPLREVLAEVLGDRFAEVGYVLRRDPDQDVLRSVVIAIRDGRVLSVLYASSSGQTSRRRLMAHSVVDADGRLHARARDESGRFKDFVLSRMSSPVIEGKHLVRPSDDPEWSGTETLVMALRGDFDASEALVSEYGIDPISMRRSVPIRKALTPYVLPLYATGRYDGEYLVEIFVEDEK